jgi:GxxExxY protein
MNTDKTQTTDSPALLHADITYRVIGLAMEVHNKLGAGFLEKVYENALMVALRREGIRAEQQVPIKIHFENVVVGDYVADILIEDKLILELKAVETVTPIHRAQVINCLKATGVRLALILNFGNPKLQHERLVL